MQSKSQVRNFESVRLLCLVPHNCLRVLCFKHIKEKLLITQESTLDAMFSHSAKFLPFVALPV